MALCYYYGDFRYFNTIILNDLTKFFLKNPTEKLTINTFSDYSHIIKLLFNDHYTTVCQIDHVKDGIALEEFLGSDKDLELSDLNSKPLSKLKFRSKLFDEKYNPETSNIICIFPQTKKISFDMFNNILEIIKDTFITKNYKIILLGKKTDTLEINNNEYIHSTDIDEMIYLLNKCNLFISPDSGFAYFAKNCATKNILLVTNQECNKSQTKYNPFNSKQYIIDFTQSITIPRFRLDYCFKNPDTIEKKYISNNRPFVSCVCPTYNRRKFLPNLLKIFNNQKYPSNLCELVIFDDSVVSNYDIIKQYNINNNIIYIHNQHNKYPIGKKRNILNQIVKGEYIVCFDDDDYYPPERISHAITKMQSAKVNLCGASLIHIYYTDLDKIYQFGPYGPSHATNGTLAYHRNYLLTHCYEDSAQQAEESLFLNKFSEPLVQLLPEKTLLCIAHGNNTFDKKKIIDSGKLLALKLNNLVSDKTLVKFYKALSSNIVA
jgi:hypothetical protein